jgi:hypothetical protein
MYRLPLDKLGALSWVAVSSRPTVSGYTSCVGLLIVVAGRGVSAQGTWDENGNLAIARSGELLTNPARCAAFRLQAALAGLMNNSPESEAMEEL